MNIATKTAKIWFPVFPPKIKRLHTDHIIAEQEEKWLRIPQDSEKKF